jgi:hypothetical protein
LQLQLVAEVELEVTPVKQSDFRVGQVAVRQVQALRDQARLGRVLLAEMTQALILIDLVVVVVAQLR